MARWGNALGGWRKQKRAKDGTFGSGRTSSVSRKKSVRKSPAKKTTKSGASKTSSKKRKPMSKKKKAAIATGAVVAVGATAYAMDYRYTKKEFNRTGPLSTQDLGNGMSVLSEREFKKRHFAVDPVAVNDVYNAKTVSQVVKAGAKVWKPSFRAQVHTTHYIQSGDQVIGYAKDVVKGRRLYADELYLSPGSRGNRRSVAALSTMMKTQHKSQVDAGRKIVISKYRSEDSERIVRNQARRLGKNKVIVKKRYDPGSEFTKEIKESMDTYFQYGIRDRHRKARAKVGVVI